MNYRDYTLGDWIEHINGIREDETTLDGNEMRDLVKFLTTMQEPKTDGDCISRQAVLNIIDSYSNSQSNADDVTQDCISDVLALPSVQQEQKTGRWKKMVSVYDMIEGRYRIIPYTYKDEELGNPPLYVCDCGNNSKKPTHYCPDCGAKMSEIPTGERSK